jgi:hypothetical protein
LRGNPLGEIIEFDRLVGVAFSDSPKVRISETCLRKRATSRSSSFSGWLMVLNSLRMSKKH